MKLFKLLILISFIALTSQSRAQEPTPLVDSNILINKLHEKAKSTTSIRAEFTEEKFVSYLTAPHKSTGIFYYKKPDLMRWEKTSPTSYIFLVNGSKVKIKENNKEKDISSFNEGIGHIRELMLALVGGEFEKYKGFNPKYLETNKTYVVNLIPKNKRLANVFDHITLAFSKETMGLLSIAFFEKSGDHSIMSFFNESQNKPLEDKVFTEF